MSCPYCGSDIEDMPIAAIVDYWCGTRYDDVQGEYYRSTECYENEKIFDSIELARVYNSKYKMIKSVRWDNAGQNIQRHWEDDC